jgi:glycerophosphoryl diester phosphodiesterase
MPLIPIYAHRLGGAYGPESSYAALERTLSAHVDGLECDVCMSADGEVFALHDPALELCTDGEGWVHDVDAAEIARLRIRDRRAEPSDQNPMPLRELLALIPDEIQLQLDVKAYADVELARLTAERSCRALIEHGTAGRAEIISFFTPACAVAREHGVRTRLVMWADYAPHALVAWAAAHGMSGVSLEGFIFSPDLRRALTDAGLTASVGSVNSRRQLERVLPLGPDILVSDNPHELAVELEAMKPRTGSARGL